jgi:hypothetical protein
MLVRSLSLLLLASSLAACGSDSTSTLAAIEAGQVGIACASDADCGDGVCLTDLSGGYCTAECSGSIGCPDGSVCAPLQNASTSGDYCAATCDDASDCRAGYSCDAAGDVRVCNPGAPIGIAGGLGDPCDAATDCVSPNASAPVCLTQGQGFPGGSCSASCEGATSCGDEGACLGTSAGQFCVSSCATSSDCRSGYECCDIGGVGNCLPDGLAPTCRAPAGGGDTGTDAGSDAGSDAGTDTGADTGTDTSTGTPPSPGAISTSCGSDADCTEGASPTCFSQAGESLCTSGCSSSADCGGDQNVCGDVGGGQAFCFRLCETQSDCREDHVCCDIGGAGVCLSTLFCQ